MLTRPRILVRRPSPRLADGELTHLARAPVDADLALRQWQGYVAVFVDRGWAVDEVEPADQHPDGVFVEDTVIVVDDLAEPRGRTVVPVPVTKVLHLKSGVTALPDGTVIGFAPLVDAPDAPTRRGAAGGSDRSTLSPGLIVPERHGTAVVDLGDGAVVMSADAPRTADLLRARGLDVVTVPVTEFEKLEGCVTCLSVRLRRPA